MIRRAHTALIAFAALYRWATSKRPRRNGLPPVPRSKSHPRAHRSMELVPAPALVDTSIERTSQVAEGDATAPQNPLKELAWMVGDWIDADEHATIETSVKWSKNDAFLIQSFRVSNLAAEPLSGMQVIAWDPAEKRIRSWTYDSRGGFGEESWSRSGDQWSMRKRFTLPDGGRASAVQVMTRAERRRIPLEVGESRDRRFAPARRRRSDGRPQVHRNLTTPAPRSADTGSHEHTRRREPAMKTTPELRFSPAWRWSLRRTRTCLGAEAPALAAGARSAGFRAAGAGANVNRSPSMSQPAGGAAGLQRPGGSSLAAQRPNTGRLAGCKGQVRQPPAPSTHPNAGRPAAFSGRMPQHLAASSGRVQVAPGGNRRPDGGGSGGIQRPNAGAPGGIQRPNAGGNGGIQRPGGGDRGGPSSDSLHDFLGTGGSNAGRQQSPS